jgi:hypothetical protein
MEILLIPYLFIIFIVGLVYGTQGMCIAAIVLLACGLIAYGLIHEF